MSRRREQIDSTTAESQQIVGQGLLSWLTIPRRLLKSSTMDLSCPIFGIVIQHTLVPPLVELECVAILRFECIRTRVTSDKVNIVGFQQGFKLRGVQL